jgi:hypothetical protein
MTGPPATRPTQSDPGGFQARADGQQVEVRSYEGDLLPIMPLAQARQLIEAGIADDLRHCVRMKLGIRWLPTRFDRPSGRPDLDRMRRKDPDRYAALWRGTRDARVGKGALGRNVGSAGRPTQNGTGPLRFLRRGGSSARALGGLDKGSPFRRFWSPHGCAGSARQPSPVFLRHRAGCVRPVIQASPGFRWPGCGLRLL